MKGAPRVLQTLPVLLFSFLLTATIASNVHADSLPTGMTLFTKEKLYAPGQTVTLVGQIHDNTTNNAILINVFTPDGERYLSSKPEVGNGVFEFGLPLNKQAQQGEWRVNVKYSGGERETTFAVVTNGLDKAILGKPALLNNQGKPVTPEEQKAGRQVAISTDLKSDYNSKQNFVFIAQVFDEKHNPVLTSFVLGSMEPFEKVNPTVSWTPATSGTYVVEIMVWDSLNNPVPLTEKQSSTFELS